MKKTFSLSAFVVMICTAAGAQTWTPLVSATTKTLSFQSTLIEKMKSKKYSTLLSYASIIVMNLNY